MSASEWAQLGYTALGGLLALAGFHVGNLWLERRARR